MDLTYLELIKLPDDQLSLHGFKRNNRGGITRIPPRHLLERRKTTGFLSFVGGLISEEVSEHIQKIRLSICKVCPLRDSKGQLLYRVIDDIPYCGKPRLSSVTDIIRDETVDGCGCDLQFKTKKTSAQCPLFRWPEIDIIESGDNITVEGQSHSLTVKKGCGGCGGKK